MLWVLCVGALLAENRAQVAGDLRLAARFEGRALGHVAI
jgi:hypothetical protein